MGGGEWGGEGKKKKVMRGALGLGLGFGFGLSKREWGEERKKGRREEGFFLYN